jgi:hypothetical protein
MLRLAAMLAAFLAPAQDDPGAKARALVERLRSDRVEERDEAARALRALGKDALPFLRKAAQDPDPEVSGRAIALTRAIDVREKVRAEARETGAVDAASVVEWLTAEPGLRVLSAEDLGLRNRKVRVSPEALEGAAAYEIAVDLLRTVDVAVAPEPGRPDRVHLVPGPLAGKRSLAVHASVEELPRGNEFCSLVLTVRHTSARDLQAALLNLASFPQNCLSVEASGKLVLSDYASNLRKMARLVRELDRPGPPSSFRLSFALLVAQAEASAHVPDRFRSLKLAEATGKNHFALAGEALARVDRPDARPSGGVIVPKPAEPAAAVVLRMGGTPALGIELVVKGGGGETLAVERLALVPERDPAGPKAAALLETRLALPRGEWVLAGAIPGPKEGTLLVLLVRADAD